MHLGYRSKRLFSVLCSMHSLLGGSPSCDFSGTTSTIFALGKTLFTIIQTFSSSSSSFCTHTVCFNGEVQGFCEIGGLSQISMSIVNNQVFPGSEESTENTSLYCEHISLNC